MKNSYSPLLFLAAITMVPSVVHADTQSTSKISWQGHDWYVKSSSSVGPGPNRWESSNVWVDSKGFLHLRIAKSNGVWSCAEIWTTESLGFGTYQCQIEGPIDKLDPNIVFSMFSYAGPDGVRETDIEYARWGNPKAKNGNWTVYPNDNKGKTGQKTFEFKLDGSYTTSRFIWSSTGIQYFLLGGHQHVDSLANLIQEWNYQPADPSHMITQSPIPLHFNLWLFEGHAPTDGKPVEIIVHSFSKS